VSEPRVRGIGPMGHHGHAGLAPSLRCRKEGGAGGRTPVGRLRASPNGTTNAIGNRLPASVAPSPRRSRQEIVRVDESPPPRRVRTDDDLLEWVPLIPQRGPAKDRAVRSRQNEEEDVSASRLAAGNQLRQLVWPPTPVQNCISSRLKIDRVAPVSETPRDVMIRSLLCATRCALTTKRAPEETGTAPPSATSAARTHRRSELIRADP